MKQLGLCLGLLMPSISPLLAQVSVDVLLGAGAPSQEQDQFLPAESLPVAVRISNRSGQTLRLGSDDDWLIFSVETRDGGVVSQTGNVPVAGEFVLESSKAATRRVDLAPSFSLLKPGRYSVTATVRVKGWGKEL